MLGQLRAFLFQSHVMFLTVSLWSTPSLPDAGSFPPHSGFSPAHLSWEWQVEDLNGLDERGHGHRDGEGRLSFPPGPGCGGG